MRASILHPFSHAEQQYLMYLNYCKGRFRVGVGVDVRKTQIGRKKYLLLVSGTRCIPSIHNREYNTYLLYVHYCKGKFRVVVDVQINKIYFSLVGQIDRTIYFSLKTLKL